MSTPKFVKIVEVSPRDGLQNEKKLLPSKIKIEFINRLSQTGLSSIETTSFVSPKWVPQLADSQIVFQGIHKNFNVQYPALVPNLKGLQRALNSGVKEIAVFATPSEAFSQRNTNCSVGESLLRISEIMNVAHKEKISVRAYVSCALGCPYEDEIAPSKVLKISKELLDKGCYEISLGDTIGKGTVLSTTRLMENIIPKISVKNLAVHFHDTYGQALVNISIALNYGINVIDSSVAGLGGCPYANGASGNVATEDVVYMLQGMGIETGIDLEKLCRVGKFISGQLGHPIRSKVGMAFSQLDLENDSL